MKKSIFVALAILIAGTVVATHLKAANNLKPNDLVWIGVTTAIENEEGTHDYLIGTIDKETYDKIELSTYDRKFLRISNLRIESEQEVAEGETKTVYLDCDDEYDWGVILIRYEDIVSIELKKRDPLEVSE